MSGADYELDFMPLLWRHPESGVAIYDEDMPDELRP
jgi:hypothetical protein